MSVAEPTIQSVVMDRGADDPFARGLTVDELMKAGTCTVKATLSDGSDLDVFRFYTDELQFTADEFVGLTVRQARKLFHDRDVEYLQTP